MIISKISRPMSTDGRSRSCAGAGNYPDRPVSKIMSLDSLPVENRDDCLMEKLQMWAAGSPPGFTQISSLSGMEMGKEFDDSASFLGWDGCAFEDWEKLVTFSWAASSIKSTLGCKFKWVSMLTDTFFGIEHNDACSQSRICTVGWKNFRNDMYPQRITGPIFSLFTGRICRMTV